VITIQGAGEYSINTALMGPNMPTGINFYSRPRDNIIVSLLKFLLSLIAALNMLA
jgi:hypothetical protein